MVTTIPMARNGQTLFMIRLAGAMQDADIDFATFDLADESLAQEVPGRILIVPNRLRHPVAYMRKLSDIVRSTGYDIVHVHGNSCTMAIDLLAAKRGGANVRIAHSHNTDCKYRWLHRMLRVPFNHLYTQGYACGQDAGKWLFGDRPFNVIPNAIDSAAFAYDAARRSAARASLHLKDDDIAVGCVGSLSERKNQTLLIDAFGQALKRRPQLRLILVGNGPLRDALADQAGRLGVSSRVDFLGERRDIPDLLNAMDLMALPSLFEGFPTVALEWQCAGLPMLLSDAITRDCALTKTVRFLPLDASAWADALAMSEPIDRAHASQTAISAIRQAGYELSGAAQRVLCDYRNLADHAGKHN